MQRTSRNRTDQHLFHISPGLAGFGVRYTSLHSSPFLVVRFLVDDVYRYIKFKIYRRMNGPDMRMRSHADLIWRTGCFDHESAFAPNFNAVSLKHVYVHSCEDCISRRHIMPISNFSMSCFSSICNLH